MFRQFFFLVSCLPYRHSVETDCQGACFSAHSGEGVINRPKAFEMWSWFHRETEACTPSSAEAGRWGIRCLQASLLLALPPDRYPQAYWMAGHVHWLLSWAAGSIFSMDAI